MAEGDQRKQPYLASMLASLLIIAFYAASSAFILDLFPTKIPVGQLTLGVDFDVAYDGLLAWAALAYSALAVGLVIAGYSASQLWRQHRSFPFGLGFATLLALGSLVPLILIGNTAVEVLRENVCREVTTSVLCVRSAPSLYYGINLLKVLLNGGFQIGATYLLITTLMVSADCASLAEKSEEYRQNCAKYDRLFLLASFLLTMIIFTDVLFLAFVREVLPGGSPLVAYQEGFVIYFAIVSSMVLVLTLVAARFVGHPLAIPGTVRTHLDSTRRDKEKEPGSIYASFIDLLKAPTTAKTVAAIAPLIAGLLGPLLDLGSSP